MGAATPTEIVVHADNLVDPADPLRVDVYDPVVSCEEVIPDTTQTISTPQVDWRVSARIVDTTSDQVAFCEATDYRLRGTVLIKAFLPSGEQTKLMLEDKKDEDAVNCWRDDDAGKTWAVRAGKPADDCEILNAKRLSKKKGARFRAQLNEVGESPVWSQAFRLLPVDVD